MKVKNSIIGQCENKAQAIRNMSNGYITQNTLLHITSTQDCILIVDKKAAKLIK